MQNLVINIYLIIPLLIINKKVAFIFILGVLIGHFTPIILQYAIKQYRKHNHNNNKHF